MANGWSFALTDKNNDSITTKSGVTTKNTLKKRMTKGEVVYVRIMPYAMTKVEGITYTVNVTKK